MKRFFKLICVGSCARTPPAPPITPPVRNDAAGLAMIALRNRSARSHHSRSSVEAISLRFKVRSAFPGSRTRTTRASAVESTLGALAGFLWAILAPRRNLARRGHGREERHPGRDPSGNGPRLVEGNSGGKESREGAEHGGTGGDQGVHERVFPIVIPVHQLILWMYILAYQAGSWF